MTRGAVRVRRACGEPADVEALVDTLATSARCGWFSATSLAATELDLSLCAARRTPHPNPLPARGAREWLSLSRLRSLLALLTLLSSRPIWIATASGTPK